MIRQFDVFRTPFRRDARDRPYVIVVQTNRFAASSRVCAPLVAEKFLRPDGRLNPLCLVEGARLYFHPIELATLPLRALRSAVTSLEAQRDQLIAALDLVFTGI